MLSYGSSEVINKIELLDAAQFMEYQNTAYANAGLPVESYPYAPDSLENPPKPSVSEVLALGADVEVDWQDEIFQTATVQDYQTRFFGRQ